MKWVRLRGMYVSGEGEVKRKGVGYVGDGEKNVKKKKKEMRRCGTWVVGKKGKKKGQKRKEGEGEGEDIQRKQRERLRKMRKEGILGVVKKINK